MSQTVSAKDKLKQRLDEIATKRKLSEVVTSPVTPIKTPLPTLVTTPAIQSPEIKLESSPTNNSSPREVKTLPQYSKIKLRMKMDILQKKKEDVDEPQKVELNPPSITQVEEVLSDKDGETSPSDRKNSSSSEGEVLSIETPKDRLSFRHFRKNFDELSQIQQVEETNTSSNQLSPRSNTIMSPRGPLQSHVYLPVSEFKSLEKKNEILKSSQSISTRPKSPGNFSQNYPLLDGISMPMDEIPTTGEEFFTNFEIFFFKVLGKEFVEGESQDELIERVLKPERIRMVHEIQDRYEDVAEPDYDIDMEDLLTTAEEHEFFWRFFSINLSDWKLCKPVIEEALTIVSESAIMIEKPIDKRTQSVLTSPKYTSSSPKIQIEIPKPENQQVSFTSPLPQKRSESVMNERPPESVLPKMETEHKRDFAGWVGILAEKKKKWLALRGSYLLVFDTETSKKETASILLQALHIENLSPEVAIKETQKSNVVKIFAKKVVYLNFETLEEAISWGNALRKASHRFTGTTITVDPSGTDKAERTISNALLKAQPLDKILIKPGTYYESVILTRSVALEGSPGVIVQSSGAPALTCSFEGSAKVSGIHFETIHSSDQISVVLLKSGSLTMSSCEIRGGRESGIKTMAATHLSLHKCLLKNNKNGMLMKGCNMATIEGSLITGNDGDGLVMMNHCMLQMKYTAISNNDGNGIYFNGEVVATIENGRMSRNKLNGIMSLSPKSNLSITKCEIYENNGQGALNGEGEALSLDSSNTVQRNGKK